MWTMGGGSDARMQLHGIQESLTMLKLSGWSRLPSDDGLTFNRQLNGSLNASWAVRCAFFSQIASAWLYSPPPGLLLSHPRNTLSPHSLSLDCSWEHALMNHDTIVSVILWLGWGYTSPRSSFLPLCYLYKRYKTWGNWHISVKLSWSHGELEWMSCTQTLGYA